MLLADFVTRCRSLAAGPDSVSAIRDAMETLVQHPDISAAVPLPADAGAAAGVDEILFEDADVSVFVVHSRPGVAQPPHDHLMSAVIGGVRGIEEQRLFRRTPDGDAPITASGTGRVGPGDVFVLGSRAVHAIHCDGPDWTTAVHVYLGHLTAVDRSIFHPDTLVEEPMTLTAYDAYCTPITES